MTEDAEPSSGTSEKPVRKRLDTVKRIRREAASVYWDLRNGKIKAFTGVACIKVLKEIREAVQFQVTEERLQRLEQLAGLAKQGRAPQTFDQTPGNLPALRKLS